MASFKAGVCVSANLSIGQFDSHNNNDTDQMKLIPEFLSGIDPKSLALGKEKGIRVRPENIHTALRELAGIEDHKFSQQFPLAVPDEERLEGLLG